MNRLTARPGRRFARLAGGSACALLATVVAPQTNTAWGATEPVVLSSGHLDVFNVTFDEMMDLTLDIKEDITGRGVHRRPEDVILHVKAQAYTNILGGWPGSPAGYLLPSVQDPELLWPGWDTSTLPTDVVEKTEIEVQEVKGPGTLYLFSQKLGSSGFVPGSVLKGGGFTLPGTIVVPDPTHVHGNWVFSAPGTYTLKVKPWGIQGDQRYEGTPATYTFVVDPVNPAPTPAPTSTAPTPTTPPPAPTPTTPPPAPRPTTPAPTSTAPAPPNPAPPNPAPPNPAPPNPAPPNPAPPNPAPSPSPTTPNPATGSVTIHQGHLDLFYVRPGTPLRLDVREDVTGHGVVRRPEQVRLVVPEAARMRVPTGLPAGGTDAYVLPMTQQPGLPWPGWSTEQLNGVDDSPVRLQITGVDGPGEVHVFSAGGLAGGVASVLDGGGTRLPGTIVVPRPAHVHANWVFTAPGRYRLTARASSATPGSTSAPASYVIDVGSVAPSPGDVPTANPSRTPGGTPGGTPGATTGGPSAPSGPGAPGSPETPGSPGTPGTPEAPGAADLPGGPGAPGSADLPGGPGAPGSADLPGGPGAPGLADSTTGLTDGGRPGARYPAVHGTSGAAQGQGQGAAAAQVDCSPVTVEVPAPAATTTPAAAAPARAASAPAPLPVATEGHFDLGTQVVGGRLQPSLKDDRTSPPRWGDPAGTVFHLGDRARLTAPAGIEFVARPGATVWMIGATQQAGVPWVGANTQHPSVVAQTTGPVTWRLDGVNGPGKVAMFMSGPLGGGVGQRLLDTVGGPREFTVPANTHQHANWVFTAPGRYDVRLTQTATTTTGAKITGSTTLHFTVGTNQPVPGAPAADVPVTAAAAPAAPAGPATIRTVVGRTRDGRPCTLPAGATTRLARTGLETLPLAATGAGLLLAGGVLVGLRRRTGRR